MINLYYRYALIPLLLFSSTIFFIEYFRLDLFFADSLYAAQGKQWMYKDSWLLSELLHTRARQLMLIALAILLTTTLASLASSSLKQYRRPLLYVLTSASLSAIFVSATKQLSNLDCPWDLIRYGGDLAYYPLFENRPKALPPATCFPAGHASAAYAWLGLYFIAQHYWQAKSWLVLCVISLLGLLYGAVQQIRGAHFISHDIWTLAICWATSFSCYLYFYKLNSQPLKGQTHEH